MFTDCKKKEFNNNKLNCYKRKSDIKTSSAKSAKEGYIVGCVR